jgi:hypothetical protein
MWRTQAGPPPLLCSPPRSLQKGPSARRGPLSSSVHLFPNRTVHDLHRPLFILSDLAVGDTPMSLVLKPPSPPLWWARPPAPLISNWAIPHFPLCLPLLQTHSEAVAAHRSSIVARTPQSSCRRTASLPKNHLGETPPVPPRPACSLVSSGAPLADPMPPAPLSHCWQPRHHRRPSCGDRARCAHVVLSRHRPHGPFWPSQQCQASSQVQAQYCGPGFLIFCFCLNFRNSYKLLKYVENTIGPKKYKTNFYRILKSWSW